MEDVTSFKKQLQSVADTVDKKLKPEQLVVMGLLLHSQEHTTLIQLATGFGKSLILALLAQQVHATTGKKVIVVVPTPFLHLYQESNYCLAASRDPADLLDPALARISYCSFD